MAEVRMKCIGLTKNTVNARVRVSNPLPVCLIFSAYSLPNCMKEFHSVIFKFES